MVVSDFTSVYFFDVFNDVYIILYGFAWFLVTLTPFYMVLDGFGIFFNILFGAAWFLNDSYIILYGLGWSFSDFYISFTWLWMCFSEFYTISHGFAWWLQ